MIERLEKPHAHSPLVLAKQHATKLGEPVGWIVERAKDRLALVDPPTLYERAFVL